jgi:hypothetical protein
MDVLFPYSSSCGVHIFWQMVKWFFFIASQTVVTNWQDPCGAKLANWQTVREKKPKEL